MVEALGSVTVLFLLVLALAFLVERALELLKTVYDLLDSRLDWHKFWTWRTKRFRNVLERRLRIFEYAKPEQAAAVLRRFRERLLAEASEYEGTVPVLSGDLVRSAGLRLALKSIGMVFGIALAFWLSIDFIEIWIEAEGREALLDPKYAPLRKAASGIGIGLGSGPVHKIITAIEKRRKRRKERS